MILSDVCSTRPVFATVSSMILVVFGVFAFIVLIGIILVLAVVLGIRMWWLGRKLPKNQESVSEQSRSKSDHQTVIEGEYQVISAKKNKD